MAVIKCKMCGGDLVLTEGQSVAECEYCGSMQTVPSADNEKKLTLFSRANRLRAACDFDKAAGVYESLVAEFPTEAEAYWGLVLCKYGIEYVDDPATGRKIPTCHRSSFEGIMEDSDFEQALENADVAARKVYRDEAKQIEEIRKGIIAVSANEEPYDIFICYKETDENGNRTLDSVLAQDIYDALTAREYRVFFARITLEDKLGQEYEPYIFAALNSAKIMLAVGTDYEYFNAVWVKNEWSRYLKLMERDKSKYLVPCYKNIDAYDMPKEFARLQAQDLGKVGAMQDLLRGIEKILPKDKPVQTVVQEKIIVQGGNSYGGPDTAMLLKRAFMFLEDGEWKSANEYCEKVLDSDPENAQAYLGKLMAELGVKNIESLKDCAEPFTQSRNYGKVIRFADERLKAELEDALAQIRASMGTEGCIIRDNVLVKYEGTFAHVTIKRGVTGIGKNAFFNCEHLVSVTIPDSVTSIGEMAFFRCDNLTSINIPANVSFIGEGAFCDCDKLADIRISEDHPVYALEGICLIDKEKGTILFGKDFSEVPTDGSVLRIGEGAFRSCTDLTAVTIPNGVISIGKRAFDYCKNLTSLTIPDSVVSIDESAFTGCYQLMDINISKNNPVYTVEGNCIIDVKRKAVIFGNAFSVIPSDGSISTIAAGAFSYSEGLSSLIIPNGITNIGMDAFSLCKNLVSVIVPDSVITIGEHAFWFCENLAAITIPESVTKFGKGTFDYCNRVTIYTQIGSYAYQWAKESGISVEEAAEYKEKRLIKERRERQEKEQSAWRLAGRCQYCGGQFKGLFGKKCVNCGKPKDY